MKPLKIELNPIVALFYHIKTGSEGKKQISFVFLVNIIS